MCDCWNQSCMMIQCNCSGQALNAIVITSDHYLQFKSKVFLTVGPTMKRSRADDTPPKTRSIVNHKSDKSKLKLKRKASLSAMKSLIIVSSVCLIYICIRFTFHPTHYNDMEIHNAAQQIPYSIHPIFESLNESNYYVVIENAFLYQSGKHHDYIFNRSLIYNQGGCHPAHYSFDQHQFEYLYHESRKTKSDWNSIENAILIAQNWGGSYFHFLIENYLRLSIVYHLLRSETGSNYTIIAYPLPNARAIENGLYSIYNLNLAHPLNITHFEQSKLYKINHLIVSKSSVCGNVNIEALAFWRDVFESYIQKNRINKNETEMNLLLHVRDPKKARALTNNNEIVLRMNHLLNKNLSLMYLNKTFKFDIFSYKKISIKETISKHFVADIIIAPHGAGLSNLIFTDLQRRVAVIEIHPKIYDHRQATNQCFARLAEALKLKYIPIWANSGDSLSTFRLNDMHKLTDAVLTAVHFII
eukprot:658863_1